MRNKFETEPQNIQPQNIQFRSFLSLLNWILEILRSCGPAVLRFCAGTFFILPSSFFYILKGLDAFLQIKYFYHTTCVEPLAASEVH